MLSLYQFPISHYCEKVRWALDYKKLDHQLVNLLPGFHAKKMLKLTGKHSVPVLHDDKEQAKAITNSSDIINYLDRQYPIPSLTPTDPSLKQQAIEWERFADREIGPHVRRICYHTLLEDPQLVIKFFSQDGPWYSKALVKIIFPKLRSKMRKLMDINQESVDQSKIKLDAAMERLHGRTKDNRFLVGEHFSRADLAVAALLAPFCCPEKYGLDWPEQYPPDLQNYIDSHAEKLQWVNKIYNNFR